MRTLDESMTYNAGRASVTFRAQPLEIDLDLRRIGDGLARAARDAITDGLKTAALSMSKHMRHGAEWIASDITWSTKSGDTFEISSPDAGNGLVATLQKMVAVLGDPMSSPTVQRALNSAVELAFRVRA